MNAHTRSVLAEVSCERLRQEVRWGEQNHPPIIWHAILGEEVGEATKEILEALFSADDTVKRDRLMRARQELIQVAAVAVATVQSLDRNELQEVPA